MANNRRQPTTMEKDAKALALHARGVTYAAIAATPNPNNNNNPLYPSREAAYQGVKRAIADISRLNAEEAVDEAEERLRLIQIGIIREMEAFNHYVISNGRFMLDPRTGDPVRDSAFYINSYQALLRVEESRRKLRGLDRPAKVEVLTRDQLDVQLAELAGRLGVSPPTPPPALPHGSDT
jgi:hypothetical protein